MTFQRGLRVDLLVVRFLILTTFLYLTVACHKEKPRDAPVNWAARGNIIKAFFTSPLKGTGKSDGFWSVDAKVFGDFIAKSRKDSSGSTSVVNAANTRYFLRIDGSFCDELFFVDGGDFTMSAGTVKKLETTNDRTVYSVVFNREVLGGIKLSQGAILSLFRAERRLVLDFPDHRLTFYPETEKPAILAERYGVSP